MKYDENIAHIVYASDDKFAEILGVSLVSLYDNSSDMEDIIVYILDNGISSVNKEKIIKVSQMYNRATPIFIQGKDVANELNMSITIDRGSLSQYSRLFVARDLPSDLERVLYLDCDIIVNKSIKELWNLNLEGNTIGALMDAFSKYYRSNINLKPASIMFNSGVMLIDLVRWKANNIENKLIEFIIEKQGKIQQGDQGALNAILSEETYCFEPRFNSVTIFYDFSYEDMLTYRQPPEFYSKKEVELAIKEPTIIHYTTSFLSKRPWYEGCRHKYVDVWIKYKNMSPWKENALWTMTMNKKTDGLTAIYHRLPNKVALRIASIMQVYVRPLKNRMRLD